MSQQPKTPARTYGALTLGIVAALLAATGRPDAETLAAVTNWGLPAPIAYSAMYVVPVAAIVAAILIGRWLGRGRSSLVRWGMYALCGAVAGFILGLCLELFAGVPGLIAVATGPLAEPTILDVFLWSFAGLCMALGLMIGGVALFGAGAMTALQVEEVNDPECLDVHKRERPVFGWSAFGMATLGLSCAALAVARQAGEGERLVPVAVALFAFILSAWASYRLWRGFDEMQRRQVMDACASSAIVVTLGTFVWALAQALGLAPAIDATGVFLALCVVQIVVASYVTTRAVGGTSLLGKPA